MIERTHDQVVFSGGLFVLDCFEGSGPWWFGWDSLIT
jgi:hypothetical protein